MNSPATSKSQARSAARLAAVQALYQQDMEKVALAKLLNEFHQHRIGREVDESRDEDMFADADVDFFDDVVAGVDARREELDGLIASKLASGWKIERLDKTMLQILRCGAYELAARKDVTTATVIDEYLDVAHAFFDEREVKFVNGLLDALAKDVRG